MTNVILVKDKETKHLFIGISGEGERSNDVYDFLKQLPNRIDVTNDVIKNTIFKMFQRGEISEEKYEQCEQRWRNG